MSVSRKPVKSGENRLISVLPQAEYTPLLQHLKQVRLKKGEMLYHAGDLVEYCYFPLSGMVSLLSITDSGETVEVGMVGNEGVTGISAILQMNVTPYQVIVQLEGVALRIEATTLLEEFNRSEMLRSLLLRYIHTLLCQISQSAVCHRFHTVEQRLSRWLLISQDRVKLNEFPLTQEFISHMLGTPRTSVTATAVELQRSGAIKYRRGQIVILDRAILERISCECYWIVKRQLDSFYQ